MTNKQLRKKIEEIRRRNVYTTPTKDNKDVVWTYDLEGLEEDTLYLTKEYALSVLPEEMSKRKETDGSDESWNSRAFSFNQAIKQAKDSIQ